MHLFSEEFYAIFIERRSTRSCPAATGPPCRDNRGPQGSTHELGVQVRYAQARVNVRLAHATALVLLAFALLLLALLAAALLASRSRLGIVEVERVTNSPAA